MTDQTESQRLKAEMEAARAAWAADAERAADAARVAAQSLLIVCARVDLLVKPVILLHTIRIRS